MDDNSAVEENREAHSRCHYLLNSCGHFDPLYQVAVRASPDELTQNTRLATVKARLKECLLANFSLTQPVCHRKRVNIPIPRSKEHYFLQPIHDVRSAHIRSPRMTNGGRVLLLCMGSFVIAFEVVRCGSIRARRRCPAGGHVRIVELGSEIE